MNSEFDTDWLTEVRRTLRGRDPSELVTTVRGGIKVQPLYTEGPPVPTAVRGSVDGRRVQRGWDIRTSHRITHRATDSEISSLRQGIADDLTGGATSLELELETGVTSDEIDQVLAEVDLAAVPLALAPHADLDMAEALVALAARRGALLADRSSLGLDPAGEWTRSGQTGDFAAVAQWVTETLHQTNGPDRWDGSQATKGPTAFTIDGVRYADAGATEAQVLGWVTASGITCLRALIGAGLAVDEAAELVGFRLPATADQFVTIAMLRAARVMWERVVTACDGSQRAARQQQHAVTAAHMYSRRDRWVNLLRASTAALAAGIAGADAVTVRPFDHVADDVGLVSDEGEVLGRRLARNTQLLLLEESHVSKLADPAGGSFHIESLTGELARAGWSIMQSTEAAGGIAVAQADGSLRAEIDEQWEDRILALSTRSEPLTGVSEYPHLEAPAEAADAGVVVDSSSTYTKYTERTEHQGLPVRRLARPFEDLRDAVDRYIRTTGVRPSVWISTLGPATAHSERTTWVQNMLAAGGIEVRVGNGVDSPIAAAADFAASGLSAAVICGSDDAYQQRAASTAAALTEAGAVFVAAVCDPGTEPGSMMAGSDNFEEVWHQGTDVVAALKRVHSVLGVV